VVEDIDVKKGMAPTRGRERNFPLVFTVLLGGVWGGLAYKGRVDHAIKMAFLLTLYNALFANEIF